MKILIPGGTGQVGTLLARAFVAAGHDVVVLSRHPAKAPWRVARWDAATVGDWAAELDGADAVINLAGRNVNCRYGAKNRQLHGVPNRFDPRRRASHRQGRPATADLAASQHGHDLRPSL